MSENALLKWKQFVCQCIAMRIIFTWYIIVQNLSSQYSSSQLTVMGNIDTLFQFFLTLYNVLSCVTVTLLEFVDFFVAVPSGYSTGWIQISNFSLNGTTIIHNFIKSALQAAIEVMHVSHHIWNFGSRIKQHIFRLIWNCAHQVRALDALMDELRLRQ